MKYRAVISYEFDAFDQPELRRRKLELAEWLAGFEQRLGPADLVVKERRPRRSGRAPAPARIWGGTPGRM